MTINCTHRRVATNIKAKTYIDKRKLHLMLARFTELVLGIVVFALDLATCTVLRLNERLSFVYRLHSGIWCGVYVLTVPSVAVVFHRIHSLCLYRLVIVLSFAAAVVSFTAMIAEVSELYCWHDIWRMHSHYNFIICKSIVVVMLCFLLCLLNATDIVVLRELQRHYLNDLCMPNGDFFANSYVKRRRNSPVFV